MKTQTLNLPFASVFEEEITAIANNYGLNQEAIISTIQPVKTWFESYWEMVFAVNNFELITAGNGSDFAQKVAVVALNQGLSETTVSFFQQCCAAFPEAIFGLKLCFSRTGKVAPTIYVRTKSAIQPGFDFLNQVLSTAEMEIMQAALSKNNTLYGLGFSEKNGQLYLKTYTIEDVETAGHKTIPGFVSHRLHGHQLSKEHKTYLPEVSLKEFCPEDIPLKDLRDFLLFRMQYMQAGHIGMLYKNGQLAEYKIYVERVGGIPTDFSAK